MTRKSLSRVLLGLAILLALIAYLDPHALLEALLRLDLDHLLFAAALIILSTLLGAYNAHLLMNAEGRVAFTDFLPIYWLAWAFGLVFPGQVGDLATLSAAMKRKGLRLAHALGRGLADKLISFLLMLSCAAWGLASLPGVAPGAGLATMLLASLILVTLFLSRRPLARVLACLHGGLPDFIATTWEETRATVRRHPRRVALNAALTCVKIGLSGLAYLAVFQALGHHALEPWRVIALAAASSIVAYLPISFNGIGTVEIAGIALFMTLGIPQADILGAYLVLRALVMTLAWGPAAAWLAAGGKSDGQALH